MAWRDLIVRESAGGVAFVRRLYPVVQRCIVVASPARQQSAARPTGIKEGCVRNARVGAASRKLPSAEKDEPPQDGVVLPLIVQAL